MSRLQKRATLVLGLAAYPVDRTWGAIDLLARSLRRNAPASRLAVITTPLGADDRSRFEQFGVTAHEFVDPVPSFDSGSELGREARRSWVLTMYAKRHSLYLRVLAEVDDSHVLLTDTRDAIVTASFKPLESETRLVLSQESARHTLGNEPWNRKWLIAGYGNMLANEIGHRPILCAGAVFGPREAIHSYVIAMSREVDRLGPSVTREIGDQPLHNVLAYTNQLPEFITSRAEDGRIRSIGVMAADDVLYDWSAGSRSEDDHDRAILIHQYDRFWHRHQMKRAIWRATGLSAVGQYAKGICRRAARLAKWSIQRSTS